MVEALFPDHDVRGEGGGAGSADAGWGYCFRGGAGSL